MTQFAEGKRFDVFSSFPVICEIWKIISANCNAAVKIKILLMMRPSVVH